MGSEEIIRGVLTGGELCQARIFGAKSGDYDLLFTDSRIVFAIVANTKKAALLGGMIGMAAARSGSANRRDLYQQMSIEQIIEHDSHNFAVPYSEIEWVDVREAKKLFNMCGFNFKWNGEQYGCLLTADQSQTAKQMATQFLRDKIRGT